MFTVPPLMVVTNESKNWLVAALRPCQMRLFPLTSNATASRGLLMFPPPITGKLTFVLLKNTSL